MFAYLTDKNIGKDGAMFYANMDINETVDHLTSGFGIIIFWVVWILIIVVIIYGFYRLENRWLDN
jgi:hypothetical protein